MRPAPAAVLDANVLFPFQLRNLLLHLAVDGLFEPLWSEQIVGECVRNLRLRAGLTDAQCGHLSGQMRAAFPEAWGTGYEGAADGLVLPDEGDRHVIALAVHHEAEFIITRNAKHFPPAVLRPFGIRPLDPDVFIVRLWRRDAPAVLAAAERHRLSLRRAPLAPERYLDSLRTHAELPRTARRLLAAGFAAMMPA
ncbi:PIN domain-containing protein [Longimicrobium sp.]|uniref:PIN domain-containing protein n=1 Tax=Longimicrobium sp. TaxID=2029185 RepID=UPI003B3A8ADA